MPAGRRRNSLAMMGLGLLPVLVSSRGWNCGVCRCEPSRGKTKIFCMNKYLEDLSEIPLSSLPANASSINFQVSNRGLKSQDFSFLLKTVLLSSVTKLLMISVTRFWSQKMSSIYFAGQNSRMQKFERLFKIIMRHSESQIKITDGKKNFCKLRH